MNTPLRRVSLAMMVLVVLLMVNDMYVQVIKSDSYSNNPLNTRTVLSEYSEPRGLITASNGIPLATSVATTDTYKYLRQYPNGPMYAPVTGYFSLIYGASGMERIENSILNGSDDRLFVRRLSDLITGRNPSGGDVQLTIDPKVQEAAYNAMIAAGYSGAAVAIQPSTGQILAMVSTPSYDPNGLASHSSTTESNAWAATNPSSLSSPLINQPVQAAYQPGSTFKLIVAAAALNNNVDSENNADLPSAPAITLPGTSTQLHNFDGETCPGGSGGMVTMKQALASSCNTAFATLAGRVGTQALVAQAQKFGFGQSLSVPLSTVASCLGPSTNGNCLNILNGQAGLYQSGIGQLNVQETPLQNAMVAATIANGGVEMQPQLVKAILAPDLSTIQGFTPQVMNNSVMSSQVASTITDMMEASEGNSGTVNKDPNITIASKTGTAEHGDNPKNTQPYGWYDAFVPGKDIAVSVVVTSGGSLDLATIGAKVAAPIARLMINAAVGGS
ncbi:MAG TPA: penicillin-binding protein 2 [Pseudonocardiaceae bacterium]|nr:penicillin-binding protein 2 [Pseudonocardiaceae bacterium]